MFVPGAPAGLPVNGITISDTLDKATTSQKMTNTLWIRPCPWYTASTRCKKRKDDAINESIHKHPAKTGSSPGLKTTGGTLMGERLSGKTYSGR
jgi:hypothetical protein